MYQQDWKVLSMMDRDLELRSIFINTNKILNEVQFEKILSTETTYINLDESFFFT